MQSLINENKRKKKLNIFHMLLHILVRPPPNGITVKGTAEISQFVTARFILKFQQQEKNLPLHHTLE